VKASPLELTWSIIALIGVILTGWMILDSWLDFRAVQRAIRGGYAKARGARWWIATGALIGNSLTAFVWAGFLLVGLIAMQYPPPPPNTDQTVSNMAAGWVLIGMEAVLAATQVWMRYVRVKVAGRPHLPTSSVQEQTL
jgi:hypothetical protein